MNVDTYRALRAHMPSAPRWAPSLAQLAVNALLLSAALFFYGFDGPAAYVLSQVLAALFLHHSYLIVHECAHNSFFPRTFLNTALGTLHGVFALLPFQVRKAEHMQHHNLSNNLDHEPTLQRAVDTFHVIERSPRLKALFNVMWRCWIPILVINEHIRLWTAPFKTKDARPRRVRRQRMSVLITGIGVALLVLAAGLSNAAAFLPAVYLYLALVEAVNLPHHFDAPLYRGRPKKLWEHDAVTESCRTIPFVSKWLMMNFNLHTEHHLYPYLPWHQLPEVHDAMIAKDARYAPAHGEFDWNVGMRRRSFEEVFSRYLSEKPSMAA
ncbi:MAG: fatty acid desaturase [Alphaproteobacteria bacterium]|nr:fatty acid desaturase [Alphaproteobacteria bacterium]